MNLGVQGNLFDLLRFNLNEDLRICFHDINNSDKIICLGRDNKGVDQKFKTKNGIDTIISAGTWSEFL